MMDGLALAHHDHSADVLTIDFLAKLVSQNCSEVGYMVKILTLGSCFTARPPRWGDLLWPLMGLKQSPVPR